MTEKTINVPAVIVADEKYCGEDCKYLRGARGFCQLFQADLSRCLGGGPLRCNDCLASEAGMNPEVKP